MRLATLALLTATALAAAIPTGGARAGDPVPGIGIALNQKPGGIIKRGETNAQGQTVFRNVPAGTYSLSGGINVTVGTPGGPSLHQRLLPSFDFTLPVARTITVTIANVD